MCGCARETLTLALPPPPPSPRGRLDLVTQCAGIKRCLDAAPLWVAAARLEERAGNLPKARALLEQARLRNPKSPALWLAAVRAEARGGNAKVGVQRWRVCGWVGGG